MMRQNLLPEDTAAANGGKSLCPIDAQCNGIPGHLTVHEDGAVNFAPFKDAPQGSCCKSPVHAQTFLGSDIIGATSESDVLLVWSSTAQRNGAKLLRSLHKARFRCTSAAAAASTTNLIRSHVRSSQLRRVQVVINPVSGQGRAQQLFAKEYAPLLDAGGVETIVLHTEHVGHARDCSSAWDLDSIDAVVCVGGDGTVHEVVQGLMARSDWQRAIRTPILQMPAGSGNALCANAGYFNGIAAVHALLRMTVVPLDLFAVTQPSRNMTYYSFLSITYGIVANMDVGTEHLRWLGGVRVLVGGLQQVITFPKSTADVAVLPLEAALQTQQSSSGTGADAAASGPKLPITEQIRVLGVDASLAQRLPQGWEHLGPDPYVIFMCCNLAWLDNDMFAPAQKAGLNTGCVDLICMRDCKRVDALSMLLNSDKVMEHPAVQYRRIQAMVFQPTTMKTWISVDGEAIPLEPIIVETLPGLARLIVAPMESMP